MMNVLFIGNSHTYMNSMPAMLLALVQAEDRGFKLSIDQITGRGVSLKWHWEHPATREMITSRSWDYVVLQDRSGGPLEEPESFREHTALLDGEIRKQGAKTILYMTWANRHRPETQAMITDAYTGMADRLKALLAPVGVVWERARRIKPEIDLYHEDGRHASPVGSYLTACVFYAMLFKKSPEGLSGALSAGGEVLVDLDENDALFLQKIAFTIINN